MSASTVPAVTLANGVEMPAVGLGTWPLSDQEAEAALTSALDLGYRRVDTAELYGNERGVGHAVKKSGVPRKDIFVTTKLTRQWHSIDGVRAACNASLERLGLDYLDLLLIHWPNPDQDRYVEAFEGLVRLADAGLVRAIGTSNFKAAHLEKLFSAGFVPHVNQIQLDPYHPREDLVAIHCERGITTETWSPIGRGSSMLSDPRILKAAHHLGRTPAQVVLRWHVQRGFVTAPKSVDPDRQLQNLNIFDFKLSVEEVSEFNSLGRHDPEMLDADNCMY